MATLNLKALFNFDNKGLQSGLKESKRAVGKFGNDIKGMLAGAFTVGAITKGIRDALIFADTVDLMAKKFRTTREEVQALDFALRPFGKDIKFLNQALGTLGQSALEAIRAPGKEKDNIFKAFGISREELERDSPLELIQKIGDALVKFDFGGKETPLVGRLIGSEAADIVPILQQNLRALADEAKAAGAVMSDSLVDELSAANKQLSNFGSEARIVFGKLAAFLLKLGGQIKDFLKLTLGSFPAFIGGFINEPSANVVDKFIAGGKEMKRQALEVLDERIRMENKLTEAVEERQASEVDAAALLQAESSARIKEAAAKELLRVEEQIAKVQFGRLSDEEKLTALKARQKVLQDSTFKSIIDSRKGLLEFEQIQDQITKLEGDSKQTGAGGPGGADSLAKIGGFIGGSASRQASNQKQMLDTVKDILSGMDRGLKIQDIG